MRRPGFEPGLMAWKAMVLPLDYRRDIQTIKEVLFKYYFIRLELEVPLVLVV